MRVIKTSYEAEQRAKDEAFLNLTPLERFQQANEIRDRMRNPTINYSYKGMKVIVKKIV